MLPHIHLIRHGETAWSLSRQHTGRTDIPLTAKGEQQAHRLGDALRAVTFTRIFSSPRQRARRTCELAGFDPAPEVEPDLCEWDYGRYEGKTTIEIVEIHPGWDLFRDGCPDGETPAQVVTRADACVARLRSCEGNVAVFSHGHFLRVLAARWVGFPVSSARHLLLDTASHSILGYEHNDDTRPVLALWNAGCN